MYLRLSSAYKVASSRDRRVSAVKWVETHSWVSALVLE